MNESLEQATFGGGCFWCTEAVFDELRGVHSVEPAYAGGHVDNPSYEAVCTGTTGHVEVIRINYDPSVITYEQLLGVFFSTHDPTTLNRQGNDVGTQYRSVIFAHDEAQAAAARDFIAGLDGVFPDPVVTTVEDLTNYWPAEDYHRDYFARNPQQGYCAAVIAPKVARFRARYADLLA